MRHLKWGLRTQIGLMLVAALLLFLNVRPFVTNDGLALQLDYGFPLTFWSRWGMMDAAGRQYFEAIQEGFSVPFLILNCAANGFLLIAAYRILRLVFERSPNQNTD